MDEYTYYVGTELKFLINITATGFSQATDDYEIKIVCNNKSITITKEDIIDDGEGNYYMLIDTSGFKSGTMRMIVTAEVPDADFPDGTRKEVMSQTLCEIRRP